MTTTDDRQRMSLETLRDCCAVAKNSPVAALLLWGSVRPLATDYADLNAWAGRREAESRNGYDFGFWMATGLEWRQDKIGLLAMHLVYIHRLVRRAERVGVDQAFADAGLYDTGGQVANIQIGDAKGRTNLEAVLNLARMALGSAGVGVLKELPRDRAEAVAKLTKSLLLPVWDNGLEIPKGVRVSKKILAMLGQHDAHSIKLALETEHAKIVRSLDLFGPHTEPGSKRGDGGEDGIDPSEPPALKPAHYEVLRVMQTHPLDAWPRGKVAAGRKDATSRGPTSPLLDDLAHPLLGFVVFPPKPGRKRTQKTPAKLTQKGRDFEIPKDRLPEY